MKKKELTSSFLEKEIASSLKLFHMPSGKKGIWFKSSGIGLVKSTVTKVGVGNWFEILQLVAT